MEIRSKITDYTDNKKKQIPEAANAKAAEAGLKLIIDERGRLVLTDGSLMLCADLSENTRRLKPDNLGRELLVRAARIKRGEGMNRLNAIDATAGFGEDSLLLAAAGFEVTLFEYDTVIAALLEDALIRAKESDSEILRNAAEHMQLVNGDSIEAMRLINDGFEDIKAERKFLNITRNINTKSGKQLSNTNEESRSGIRPDIILLDPMFPAREKSALIKKKFQLLQMLEHPCTDETALLEAAIAARPHKIVIKRPLKGPFLAGRKPDYSIKGKAVRYDCIVMV